MSVQILIDLGKLKHLYSGLGQFSFFFGKHILEVQQDFFSWNFLIPGNYLGQFGTRQQNEILSFKRRYTPFICKRYDLWHSIHQDSAYYPGNSGTPYILTIHDLNFLREKSADKIKKRLAGLQKKIERASYITFISNYTESEAKNYLKLENKSARVIYNGVDIDIFKETPVPGYLPPGKFLFAAGMILEKKNFHTLISFIEELKDFNLIVAGDKSSRYADKMEKEIREKNLSGKIIMPGIISQSDKIFLYRNCSAFLFPSLTEGFGLPVIEAMRFGKPVFLSTLTSLPEIGGDAAFYWKNFDPVYMKDQFIACMNLHSQNESVNRDKIMSHSQKFSWETAISQYMDVYREISGK